MSDKNNEKKKGKAKSSGAKQWFFVGNIIFRVLQALLIFALVCLLLVGSLAAGIGAGYFAYLVSDTELPTKEQLEKEINDIDEVSHLAYADGTEIATIRSDLMRTKISSEEISPLVKQAVISTEDEYFPEHHGVVPKALIRALISDATGLGGSSGGSTLTQQLVKQQILTDETTFKRKADEILLAVRIEKFFTKDEILTTYLNVSPFGRNNKGENIAGVEEAARGIFGVNASDLTLPQAAFIAGLPQSPIVYSPYTNTGELKEDQSAGMERKDFVLFNMYKEKMISQEEYEQAKSYDLTQDFQGQAERSQNDNGFLYYKVLDEAVKVILDKNAKADGLTAEDLKDEATYDNYYAQAEREIRRGGYTVQSTIDQNIYQTMQDAVRDYGGYLDEGAGRVETGNVLMENSTGKILGFVGSRDYATNQNNHAFDTERQAASTIKPLLVYAPAIDQGYIGSESMLADFPTKYSSGEELKNASGTDSNKFETVRFALTRSYNIPVYNLNEYMKQEQGSSTFSYDEYLSKMNFPASDNWGVESAPLGTQEVSVLTQTNGFQTLANHGEYQEGYMIEKITDTAGTVIYEHKPEPVQVFSVATASIMTDLLRSVIDSNYTTQFKAIIGGVDQGAASADWVGKTGTTNDYKDSWLILSTPNITISTWTGYDENVPLNPNSAENNANYTARLISNIHQTNPDLLAVDQRFTLDASVKQEKVSDFTGQKAGKLTYNGKTITVPGKETTSLWAKNGPKQSEYKFGIGGTDANYQSVWSSYFSTRSSTSTSSSKEKSDDKDKEND